MDGFKVLTEFRFDIGTALINSEKLAKGVDAISSSADNALAHFQALSVGIVGSLGIGNMSLLSGLKKVMDLSDEFAGSTKSWANLISTNFNYLSGNILNYSDRLATSRDLLDSISATASKLGVSSSGMSSVSQSLVGALAPTRNAGHNFKNATNLAGNAMHATKGLGIDPSTLGSELVTMLTSSEIGEGGIFGMLVGSTKVFKEFKGDAESFAALPLKARMAKLNQGFKELDSVMGDAGSRIVTINDLIEKFKEIIFGLGSSLRKIGDTVLQPMLVLLDQWGGKISEIIPKIAGSVNMALKQMMGDPRKTILDFAQVKELGHDFSAAKHVFEFGLMVKGILEVMKWLKVIPKTATMLTVAKKAATLGASGAGYVAEGAANLAHAAEYAITSNGLYLLSGAFKLFRGILMDVFLPIAVLTMFFQTISRARAIAKVNDAERMITMSPQIAAVMAHLSVAFGNIMRPIQNFIDVFGELLAPMFETTHYLGALLWLLDLFAEIMDIMGTIVIALSATFASLMQQLVVMVHDVSHGNFSGMGERMSTAGYSAFEDYMKKNLHKVDDGTGVSNQITNIGKVEIKNAFQEGYEPDRIAFTMKDQIQKAAANRTQSRGNSMAIAGSR